MRRVQTFSGLAAALALAGCGWVVSSAPIVTADDAGFDPRLVGEWEDDAGSRMVIARGDGNGYTIEYTPVFDPGPEHGRHTVATGHFTARLGRLGGRTILDVQPAFDPPEPYDGLIIPGHLLFVLHSVDEDELRLQLLEIDSVVAHLESGALPLAHSLVPGSGPFDGPEQVILHGGTAELRAGFEAYLDRPGVLGDPSPMRRVR